MAGSGGIRLWCASCGHPRAHRGTPPRARGSARQRPPRVAERPAPGSEREVLPGSPRPLHRRRRAGTPGGRRKEDRRGEAAMKRPLLLLVLLAGLARDVLAHEVRPAYLELRQSDAETYDVLWKVPGRGEGERFGLYVQLPAACANLAPPRSFFIDNAFTDRWTVRCAGGLVGGTIHVAGLASTVTDVLVRLERLDGRAQALRLTPSAPSFVVEAAPGRLRVAATYLRLGIDHILLGVDHL